MQGVSGYNPLGSITFFENNNNYFLYWYSKRLEKISYETNEKEFLNPKYLVLF